jgi:hypothetical protein
MIEVQQQIAGVLRDGIGTEIHIAAGLVAPAQKTHGVGIQQLGRRPIASRQTLPPWGVDQAQFITRPGDGRQLRP